MHHGALQVVTRISAVAHSVSKLNGTTQTGTNPLQNNEEIKRSQTHLRTNAIYLHLVPGFLWLGERHPSPPKPPLHVACLPYEEVWIFRFDDQTQTVRLWTAIRGGLGVGVGIVDVVDGTIRSPSTATLP